MYVICIYFNQKFGVEMNNENEKKKYYVSIKPARISRKNIKVLWDIFPKAQGKKMFTVSIEDTRVASDVLDWLGMTTTPKDISGGESFIRIVAVMEPSNEPVIIMLCEDVVEISTLNEKVFSEIMYNVEEFASDEDPHYIERMVT